MANQYNGLIRKLASVALVTACTLGCNYEKPVNEQSSNYPKIESKVSTPEHSEKGLEGKVKAKEESERKRTTPPEVSYEKVIEFFEPEMTKAKVSPQEIKGFRDFMKEDSETRNLFYAIYSNPRKFEENYGESSRDRFTEFKKNPLEHIDEEELSELHNAFPLISGKKEELGYLKDTTKLSDKQYGDLIFLFMNHELRGMSSAAMMFSH